MNTIIKKMLPLIDILLAPFVFCSAFVLKSVRTIGVASLPISKRIMLSVGVFPIRDHYYEPLFNPRHINKPLSDDRCLPGIDFNVEEQLSLIGKFQFGEELKDISDTKIDDLSYYKSNNQFGAGDAEYWYNIIRRIKPRKIVEIGSGNSTLMAIKAIKRNIADDSSYECEHTCIEPFEMPWLEKTGISVLRDKVEDVDVGLFSQLDENDILFIDSSHIIRPQGDVVVEFLHILPSLSKGVIVHVHDIFSPKDYPESWVLEDVRLWNEQYLLEAFLTCNTDWKIIGALNYLKHHQYDELKKNSPFLTLDSEPGSFYIQKVA